MRKRLALAGLLSMIVLVALAPTGTTAPEDEALRFSAAGDFSSSTAARGVLEGIGALNNNMTIALGDLSYGATGAEQAWCDLVTARVGAGYPFELLAGNHEGNGQNGNINDFSACLPNQLPGAVGTYGRQYYVDVPRANPLVRHVMISPAIQFPDSTWSYAAGTAPYNWTASAIDGARAAGIPWVVVSMHKPCLSVGQYACDPGAALLNLLVSKKVDLVLSGHEHHYSRTKQLALGGGCAAVAPGSYNSSCVADADSSLRKGAGTLFATVGTGGVELRDVFNADPEMPYFVAASGSNQQPTFGFLDVDVRASTLTARFVGTSGGAFTDAFTITQGEEPPNVPPVASFTSTVNNLIATLTSTSTDSDGTVTGHAWNFGDGTTAMGATVQHTYAQAGTYDVTLTVTDNDGATGAVTRQVTVVAPPPGPVPYATDTFTRSVTGGWGSADTGGAWTNSGSATNFSVANGTGRIRMGSAGSGPSEALNAVAKTDTEVRVDVATDKAATGGGTYLTVEPRVVSGNRYFADLRLLSTGGAAVTLGRVVAGTETALQTRTLTGLTYQPGTALRLRVQATGTSPTTLRAKVWPVGTPEPADWVASVTDTTAALQASGGIVLRTYLSSSATNAPMVASFDNLWAGPTG